MRYYRCKCGERQSWGTMPPDRCASCDKCGSDLAESPASHGEPSPHKFYTEQVETDDFPRPLTRCRFCHRTKREILDEIVASDARLRAFILEDLKTYTSAVTIASKLHINPSAGWANQKWLAINKRATDVLKALEAEGLAVCDRGIYGPPEAVR